MTLFVTSLAMPDSQSSNMRYIWQTMSALFLVSARISRL